MNYDPNTQTFTVKPRHDPAAELAALSDDALNLLMQHIVRAFLVAARGVE